MVLSGDVRLVACTKDAPRSRASTCPKYSCNVIAYSQINQTNTPLSANSFIYENLKFVGYHVNEE